MTNFEYPYPGFSWSITQHVAPATNVNTLFEFLRASYMFSKSPQYQSKITDYMISKNLLTANIRKDQAKPQLWRDYQQILPEIGLIVSTKFTKGISVTPIGLLWLDGAIGYSEMLTTQCINYQYPNGHKQDISPTLQKNISGLKLKTNNKVTLDSLHGVLIKPAVLILRILIELAKKADFKGLSVDETVTCLMPTKRNKEWSSALARLTVFRNSTMPKTDTRRKRHVQEWYRLLSLTDLFGLSNNKVHQKVTLSQFSLNNLLYVERFCEFHEQENTFWFPETEDSTQLGLSWFEHFGAPSIERQWATEIENLTPNYIKKNYPDGVYEMEDEYEKSFGNMEITLSNLKELSSTQKSFSKEISIDNIIEGHKKREEKTRLHDKIVSLLANKMTGLDYQVWEDRNSVDLLAKKANTEIIFEVKTVNKNNLSRHIRLGVGQLIEYRYRRELQISKRPQGLLVLSSKYNFPKWMIKYFETDINLGLISFEGQESFTNFTSGRIEKLISAT